MYREYKYYQHVLFMKGVGRTGQNVINFSLVSSVSLSVDQLASTTFLGYLCTQGEKLDMITFNLFREGEMVLHS